MAKQFFKSTVGEIIDFDPLENPPWRTKTRTARSTQEMIKDIVRWKRDWDSKKENYDDVFVDNLKQQLEAKFFYHCNVEEDHGIKKLAEIESFLKTWDGEDSKEGNVLSLEKQETANLGDAYSYLKSESEDVENHGLLEESMLRNVNKIILRNILRSKCLTKPGKYSDKSRVTIFQGETYFYQQPNDMTEAVCLLLDRFNSLFTESVNKTDEVEKLGGIFKSVAWLVFELLDLHPFSDGNGRLCRLLCSYILSTITPFPSPIYNMYSESSQKDFESELVKTRKSVSRKPSGLTTMIIESNWAMWENLEKKLQEYKCDPIVATEKVLLLSQRCPQSLKPELGNPLLEAITNAA